MDIFDSKFDLLSKAIELRSKKNEILASNIANRETPGYKAADIVFNKALQKAYYKNQPSPLKTTHPLHFSGDNRQSITQIKGQEITSFNPEARFDGNTVDLEQQMSKLAANQLLFEANTKAITKRFQILKDTIIEGGK